MLTTVSTNETCVENKKGRFCSYFDCYFLDIFPEDHKRGRLSLDKS